MIMVEDQIGVYAVSAPPIATLSCVDGDFRGVFTVGSLAWFPKMADRLRRAMRGFQDPQRHVFVWVHLHRAVVF